MGIPKLLRWHIYIESVPWWSELDVVSLSTRSKDIYLVSTWHRTFGTSFVSEVRESGPWRTSVTGHRNGLLKQKARIPHADCLKSPSERAVVGAVRWRAAVTSCWDELLKQMARSPGADCFRSPSQRAVGVDRGRTSVAGRWDGLMKQKAKVRQSGPWGRFVAGRPSRAAGMDFWNKRHVFLASTVLSDHDFNNLTLSSPTTE